MGLIAKILSFVRSEVNGAKVSDVKTDPGGGANKTAQHFSPAGDDAHPLTTDYCVLLPIQQQGVTACVGYVDPLNIGITQAGEKRIYARDTTGQVKAQVHLKSTGESIIFNDNGFIKLEADGTVNINGTTFAASTGLVTAGTGIFTSSLQVTGKELSNHTHPAGTPPGDTGVNN